MKTRFFRALITGAILVVSSCQNGSKETAIEVPASHESNDVVIDSLTDDKGLTLRMKFDNAAGTATFVFDSDTILLKQDTMASGISYSNEHYIFTEHQGDATLTKEGNIVFKKLRKPGD
jgi:membrane-bound inhibitor of C-type lysozyme